MTDLATLTEQCLEEPRFEYPDDALDGTPEGAILGAREPRVVVLEQLEGPVCL